ncbi:ABC transporter permease [Dechloromonas denitrificans]|uniref:ABC transporter permease n=1 Tax=Dechloromonas denitrificans TaxID=281362 RepID=UPI001CF7F846|nr:ABC transporter permease [Dechloromonas denitrificans]UCV01917.1 ABC transporter permease [Dechloromonas denitrificans]UCV06251.1 ABC transporter permease [Dechloromonas denitrificans]
MSNSLFSLALRNVIRQRARSIATLIAIAIGVAGLILAGGFVQDIFIQLGEAIIHSQTGHIQLTRQGYSDGKNRAPEKYLIENPDTLKSEIRQSVPQTKLAMARLGFSGVLNNGKRDLGIVGEGIEPDAESTLGTYLQFIEGRALTSNDQDGIIIGQGVARSLGLKVGDRINLVMTLSQGAVNTLDFEVIGVFQSFSKEFDARAVRIPLEAAKSLMDTPAAHLVVVTLEHTEDTAAAVNVLKLRFSKNGFNVTTWKELSDFYEKTVELYDRQFGVLRLIILIMVLLSVVNSVNMTLFERTREFGTMLAVGNRSSTVFKLIMLESLCLGVLGALIGMAFGCLAAIGISAVGIPMPPPPNANLGYTALIRIVPSSVLTAGAIGFVATMLATIMPAQRAAKLEIVEALRHGI